MPETVWPVDVAVTFEDHIDEADYPRIEGLIEEAELRIEETLNVELIDWISAGPPRREKTVRSVVIEMVQRVLRAPGALVSESEQSYSYSLDREAARALLELTEKQLARLRGTVAGTGSGFGVIRLQVPSWSGRYTPAYGVGGGVRDSMRPRESRW